MTPVFKLKSELCGGQAGAGRLQLEACRLFPQIDLQARMWYKIKGWQRSSVVEQGTHKPLVSGPNPLVATIFLSERDLGTIDQRLNTLSRSWSRLR